MWAVAHEWSHVRPVTLCYCTHAEGIRVVEGHIEPPGSPVCNLFRCCQHGYVRQDQCRNCVPVFFL